MNNYKKSNFLKNLDNSKEPGYSLWKAAKYLKHPTKRNVPIIAEDGSWCRNSKSKADAFLQRLEKIYKPFPLTNTVDENVIF